MFFQVLEPCIQHLLNPEQIGPGQVPLLIKPTIHLAAQLVKPSVARPLQVTQTVIVNQQAHQNCKRGQTRRDKRGCQL